MSIRKTLAFLICFTFLGASVVPASLRPCCCKSDAQAGKMKPKAGCCGTKATTAPCCAKATDTPTKCPPNECGAPGAQKKSIKCACMVCNLVDAVALLPATPPDQRDPAQIAGSGGVIYATAYVCPSHISKPDDLLIAGAAPSGTSHLSRKCVLLF
ncbi:MAG: hypothetical protein V2B18_16520 [Pseudomonadota bacterium]